MVLKRIGLLLFLATFIASNPHRGYRNRKVKEGEEWWRKEIIYQIYPLSMKDSDNDGKGDLKGIYQTLPYLRDTGIGAVWISPVYPSPMKDNGYDISDFTGIDSTYGTMDDFDRLVKEAHKLGLKVIMDLVPNHSSDKHEWFEKSVKREKDYEDYYVWKDPKGWDQDGKPVPPNNWVSVFRGPAWTYNKIRKQFYLHQFAKEQPDLNYRSPNVRKEMNKVIRFWVKKGVDGFRIDAVACLFEDEDFRDEPVLNKHLDSDDYEYLHHIFTISQRENYKLIQEWRALIDEENRKDGGERCLMVEVFADIKDIMKYYGTSKEPGAHFPFNFQIISTTKKTTVHELKKNIDTWFDDLNNYAPDLEKKHTLWAIGSHDEPRVGSRVGPELVDGMNMLALLLPGSSVTYYGEEIGMLNNNEITYKQGHDTRGCNYGEDQFKPKSRDFQRTPFQWNNSTNAGFSLAEEPWLPVNENYRELNLEFQKQNLYSHYTIYKDLIKIRQTSAIRSGNFIVKILGSGTLGFLRRRNDHGNDVDDIDYIDDVDYVVVLVNFSPHRDQIDLDKEFQLGYPKLEVYTTNRECKLEKESFIGTENLELQPKCSVVLTCKTGKHNASVSSLFQKKILLLIWMVILTLF